MTRGYTTPRPCYSFGAPGRFSWVRDAWAKTHPLDAEDADGAADRLRDFERWQGEAVAKFATVDSSTAAALVPPGYKGLVADFTEGRPLWNAATHGELANASSFTAPGTASGVGGLTGDHTEGQPATEGTLSFTGPVTVSPKLVAGKLPLTREIVDASTPAVDVVVLAALRESYARQVEAKLYAAVNGAGTSRSSTDLAGDLAPAVAAFVGQRRQVARNVVIGATVAESVANLDTRALALQDITIAFSPDFTTGTSDYDAVVLGRGDLWGWSSPMLSLRLFEEKTGPEVVEASLWGYAAAALLDQDGVIGVQVT